MKIEKKHLIIIAVVVILIALWYFFLRKKPTTSKYLDTTGGESTIGKARPKGGSRYLGIDSLDANLPMIGRESDY